MIIEILFGIITGLSIVFYILLEYFLGFHTTRIAAAEYSNYITFIISFVPLYFWMKYKCRSSAGGTVSYGRAATTGIVISLIATIIATTFTIFYLKFINPEFSDARIAFESNKLFAAGIPEEIVIQKVNGLRLQYSFGAQIIVMFFGQLIFSTLYSLLLSILFTKNTIAKLIFHQGKKRGSIKK